MIKKLTPEQLSKLPEYARRWTQIGLSTAPIDLPRAKRGVEMAYRAAGLEPPRMVLVAGSPMGGAMMAHLLQVEAQVREQVGGQVREQVEAQVRDQVWEQVRAQVVAQVWDQVRAQVWDQVGGQVRAQVEAQVWDQVGGQVRAQVEAQVGGQVEDHVREQVEEQVGGQVWERVGEQVGAQVEAQVEAQVRDQVGEQVADQVRDQESLRANVDAMRWGSHDAGWLSFYRFFRDECGLECTEPLRGLWEIAESCGWWAPYRGVAILQERHCVLRRDPEGRIHCEDGPAIAYPDGWSIYAWHGTRVPEEWITKRDQLDPATALTWENIEQRRAAAEIIGWARVLDQLDARVIQTDPDPTVGQLLEVDLPDAGRERFLKVRCGTGRIFCLPVPPEMQTALQANAWTYGVDEIDIRTLEIRT